MQILGQEDINCVSGGMGPQLIAGIVLLGVGGASLIFGGAAFLAACIWNCSDHRAYDIYTGKREPDYDTKPCHPCCKPVTGITALAGAVVAGVGAAVAFTAPGA